MEATRAGGDGRPLVALTLGDPAGIGPEIALAAARDPDTRERMRLVLLGPGRLRPAGWTDATWEDTGGPSEWKMGQPQAECGRAAISALRRGHELALEGRVDALVTAPV